MTGANPTGPSCKYLLGPAYSNTASPQGVKSNAKNHIWEGLFSCRSGPSQLQWHKWFQIVHFLNSSKKGFAKFYITEISSLLLTRTASGLKENRFANILLTLWWDSPPTPCTGFHLRRAFETYLIWWGGGRHFFLFLFFSNTPSDIAQRILFFLNERLYSFCPNRMEKTFPNKEVLLLPCV